ncbi:MAG TPA: DUF3618 domain-containing protein [Solirubrobacterales bacterium]|jgi:ElaB/YqjD/DUF883 family membrane-anchored ribosome-binding protein|nr:DUF3618 domain-containing protein [Solirubrobacterales bacterium]
MSAAEKGQSPTADEQGTHDPGEIRQDIEETRAELGETVAAVAEKTDVKKQAQAKADELKQQAAAKAEEAKTKAREVGEKAKEAAPDNAGEGVQQAQRLAQENPVPMALAGAFVAGLLVGRMLSR